MLEKPKPISLVPRNSLMLFYVVVFFVLFLSTLSLADEMEFGGHSFRLREKLQRRHLIITLWKAEVDSNFPYDKKLLWGEGAVCITKGVLTNIDVSWGRKKLYILFSAYADLAGISRVKSKLHTNGFELLLWGPKGRCSYKAVLQFKNGYLVRKRVYLPANPLAVEEIKYGYNKCRSC